MIRIKASYYLVCLCFIFSVFSTTAYALHSTPNYIPSEHLILGNKVNLHLNKSSEQSSVPYLSLPNGLKLTYGEIISLGDFYGEPSQPISQATTETERKNRFLNAFNSFTFEQNAVHEVNLIINTIIEEKKFVEDQIREGVDPETAYMKIYYKINHKFNCITGGGCSATNYFKPGRYVKLLTTDYDHFGEDAWITYETGHAIAIEKAIEAHKTSDMQKLQLAYAMNAFACHFLSDRFAAGHIRTPRLKLDQAVHPKVIGSLLSSFMHHEDNHFGTYMYNRRGNHWMVYGDKLYRDPRNMTNTDLLNEALQQSADEIFAAFNKGYAQDSHVVYDLIPFSCIEENNQFVSTPLFYWDSKSQKLLRRVDLDDIYDKRMTSRWMGWTTLVQLASLRGITGQLQGQLAVAGLGKQGIKDGLITDQAVVNYIHSHEK